MTKMERMSKDRLKEEIQEVKLQSTWLSIVSLILLLAAFLFFILLPSDFLCVAITSLVIAIIFGIFNQYVWKKYKELKEKL